MYKEVTLPSEITQLLRFSKKVTSSEHTLKDRRRLQSASLKLPHKEDNSVAHDNGGVS